MGIIIYVTGEGTIDGDLTETKISAIKEIKDGWEFPAFSVSKNGSGFEFAESTMEGLDPYSDGILKPLNSLIEYAKAQELVIDAEFAVTSDCDDYDNIEVIVSDNELATANSEIVNATSEELNAELQKRESVNSFNGKRYILTNISQDVEGTVYAGAPTFFDTEEAAIDSARKQLADDYSISLKEVSYNAQEGGTPYVLSMSRNGRFEAYTVSRI